MTLPSLETAVRYLQRESAAMYRDSREAIDFPWLHVDYQQRAAALSYASRVLAGVEAP
jgi:hypothetical protein